MLNIQTVWGWPIALYLFLAGISAGAYLTGAYWMYKLGENNIITKVGMFLAAPCVGLSILMLFFDLGRPFRFIHAFSRPFESWISIGAWVLTIFLIISAWQWVKLFICNQKKVEMNTSKWVWAFGIIFAFFTAVYTGILLGVINAIPFWNTPLLPMLFFISALSTGIGAVFLGTVFILHKKDAEENQTGYVEPFYTLSSIDGILIILEILCLAFYLLIMGYGQPGMAATNSVKIIISGSLAPAFWLGVMIIGLLIPLVMEFIMARKHLVEKSVLFSRITVSSICLLIGGLTLRYIILHAGIYL